MAIFWNIFLIIMDSVLAAELGYQIAKRSFLIHELGVKNLRVFVAEFRYFHIVCRKRICRLILKKF